MSAFDNTEWDEMLNPDPVPMRYLVSWLVDEEQHMTSFLPYPGFGPEAALADVLVREPGAHQVILTRIGPSMSVN